MDNYILGGIAFAETDAVKICKTYSPMISIHSLITEADSKYAYFYNAIIIFFVKLYHFLLPYTSHHPIFSIFLKTLLKLSGANLLTFYVHLTFAPKQNWFKKTILPLITIALTL